MLHRPVELAPFIGTWLTDLAKVTLVSANLANTGIRRRRKCGIAHRTSPNSRCGNLGPRRIKCSESCAPKCHFLLQSLASTNGVITDCGLDGFLSQILPRQIRVHKGLRDSAHTARGAIIDEFHCSHGTTSDEVEPSGFEWDEITELLIKSYPTSRASDLSNRLWTNPHLVQHPQNREIFATRRAVGEELMAHKASFLPDCSVRWNSSGD